jgi:hypothetical protein
VENTGTWNLKLICSKVPKHLLRSPCRRHATAGKQKKDVKKATINVKNLQKPGKTRKIQVFARLRIAKE